MSETVALAREGSPPRVGFASASFNRSRASWDTKYHEAPYIRFADPNEPRRRFDNETYPSGRVEWVVENGIRTQIGNSNRPSTVGVRRARPLTGVDVDVANARPSTVAVGEIRGIPIRGIPTLTKREKPRFGSPRFGGYGSKYAGLACTSVHGDDSYHPHHVGPTEFGFGAWTSDLNAGTKHGFEGILGTRYAGFKNISSIGHDGLWATGKCGPFKSDIAPWRHEAEPRRAARKDPSLTCTKQNFPLHELRLEQWLNPKEGPPRPNLPATKARRVIAPPLEGQVKCPADKTERFYSRPVEPLVLRRFKAQHPPRPSTVPTALELHEKCKRRMDFRQKKVELEEVKALDEWEPAPPKEEEEVEDPKKKGKKPPPKTDDKSKKALDKGKPKK
mmetsp:Transcript_2213/g.3772  ORF Transcript_2213/g.3772 Transcript_2213/m.3772 type:complete len:390 (+) Transcript_2213:186-1355(+)|eukprot:CAMPEP_0198199766 /NCGR_PEP_ID=MMETSP1445-20131203/2942_1 /TAXON_ID=36898 /ORGANISM="Pyramimonas sp., Strain CCMP2087" /LENGTH=389 /DNA_ID=CAMNT_0043869659 /DNA_START=155 /DNA_END=1324 /DNA_ORIENTATION=+